MSPSRTMMTNKILSIDIDFCKSSKDFIRVFDLFCRNLFKLNKDSVLISEYHVDILDLIQHATRPIEIVNIDDHHDVYYNKEELPGLRNQMVYSSNWVGWLFMNAEVRDYLWISNQLSDSFTPDMLDDFKCIYSKGSQYDVIDSRNVLFNNKKAITQKISDTYLKFKPSIRQDTIIKDSIFDIDFDYMFVCKSPDYTPKENYFMYDAMESLARNFFNLNKNKNDQKKI